MDKCYMAVNKKTGNFFGGKKQRTHIGYPKLNFLKSAMTNAKVDKSEYYFVSISFDEYMIPDVNDIE